MELSVHTIPALSTCSFQTVMNFSGALMLALSPIYNLGVVAIMGWRTCMTVYCVFVSLFVQLKSLPIFENILCSYICPCIHIPLRIEAFYRYCREGRLIDLMVLSNIYFFCTSWESSFTSF